MTSSCRKGFLEAPVLDLRSGAVCAIVKSTRGRDRTGGAQMTPVIALQEVFPDLWQRSAQQVFGGWPIALQTSLRRRASGPPGSTPLAGGISSGSG